MSPHVKTLFLPQPSGSFGIWCKGHESMDPSCLWSKVQAGAGRDVRSPIEHLCDVMRRKILLQDVQMMTATFFFIPSCTTSFFKLLFWLSSIMFNSSLVNSFISCTLLYFCCFLKTQIIFILYLFILAQENPLLFFFLLNVSNLCY